MHYTNPHFTYLLTYLIVNFKQRQLKNLELLVFVQ